MWKLKEPVKIILKRHGLVITQESLARNQTLADVVMEDTVYRQRYGHNFIQTDGAGKDIPAPTKPDQLDIEVNVKKKADALKESKQPASTSTEAKADGMILNVKEAAPESVSQESQQLNRAQRREKLKQQNSGASGVTGK